MDRTLTDADAQAIADFIHLKTVEHCRYRVDPNTHDPQHAYIQNMMDRQKLWDARVQKVQDYVAGAVVLGAFLWFLSFLGRSFLDYVRNGGSPQ